MKHHILSIGITKYQIPEANNLEYAAKDAEDFYKLFCDNIGQIGYRKFLIDSEATLTQIRTALGKELQKEVEVDDTLFIFFSGHGATDTSEDGTLAHFLIPYDATRDIAHSAISVTFLKKALDDIKCKAKVVFIDSCFSGSATSKHFPVVATKDFKSVPVKTIVSTVSGSGDIVMTASKDNEESIEDKQNKNGLFTYYLLHELQKENGRANIPIETIFTPISEAVSKRVKDFYQHKQTPTMGGVIQGGLLLPKFVNKLSFKPTFIAMPKYNHNAPIAQIPIAEIQVSDKEQEKELKGQIDFVINTTAMDQKFQKVEFEKVCKKMFSEIEEKYNETFQNFGSDLSRLPEFVATMEAVSSQFIMFGNVIAAYGSSHQMKIYSYYVGQILKLGEGRAGYVVLTTIPEIIITDIISSIGIGSIAREDLDPLNWLLQTPVTLNYNSPLPLWHYNQVFFCDAVGNDSTKVHDHVRKLLQTYTWLPEIAPRLELSQLLDYDLQLNLLLVVLLTNNKIPLWADFGKFEAHRVRPLLDKIVNDFSFRNQVSSLFSIKEESVKDYIVKAFEVIYQQWRQYANGYFWRSVSDVDKILYPEKEQMGKGNA